MPTVEEVVGKYVELRDRKAEKAKQQTEEMRPINEAMEQIENYLLHQLNVIGSESIRTEKGTVFKSNTSSVQMQDPVEFKSFVFEPVASGIFNYLINSGYEIRDIDAQSIKNIIRDLPLWGMIDFRAGKKGITEYVTNENKPVPGVAVNTVTTVNIRRA